MISSKSFDALSFCIGIFSSAFFSPSTIVCCLLYIFWFIDFCFTFSFVYYFADFLYSICFSVPLLPFSFDHYRYTSRLRCSLHIEQVTFETLALAINSFLVDLLLAGCVCSSSRLPVSYVK